MTTAGEAIQYVRWKRDVADHDYAAASSYLSIRFGASRAREVSENLKSSRLSTAAPTTSCGLPGATRCRCRTRAW